MSSFNIGTSSVSIIVFPSVWKPVICVIQRYNRMGWGSSSMKWELNQMFYVEVRLARRRVYEMTLDHCPLSYLVWRHGTNCWFLAWGQVKWLPPPTAEMKSFYLHLNSLFLLSCMAVNLQFRETLMTWDFLNVKILCKNVQIS